MALQPRQGYLRPPSAPAAADTSKLLSALQKQIDDVKGDSSRANDIKAAFAGGQPAHLLSGQKAIQNGPAKPKDAKGKRDTCQKAPKDMKPPAALAGSAMRSSKASGALRMCFSYNLGTCKPKGECSKGAHLCSKMVNGEACSRKDCIASNCTR